MSRQDRTDQDPSGGETSDAEIGYASALNELETILAELEDDNVDIDVLSVRVERAAQLISVCRNRIRKADERVSRIVSDLESNDDARNDGTRNDDTRNDHELNDNEVNDNELNDGDHFGESE